MLHAEERPSSSIGNYFKYCVNIAVVAEHGLDEGLVALVKRHCTSLIRGLYRASGSSYNIAQKWATMVEQLT
jgi:hypothetical protein